ncbi:MAG TPA: phosphoadenylyl-sulfate reductase [Acidimicrobiia bacterium]|jgi:phosphoadenosine phosphosulfate reductase|nr:phosphoadenylyl-sulfate reductase [Acidimicrobiia bacterium]HIL46537.1 phosphoadenylyl-sulfate reductase [Acidimicrobiia bacterium]
METITTVNIRRTPALNATEIEKLNTQYETAHPCEIITWAQQNFGHNLALTTSFSDTLLIDLALKVDPDLEVIFLDTGYHFSQTLQTLRQAQKRYRINLRVIRPQPPAADLWAADTDQCCNQRKVEPLNQALADKTAWLSGLRRTDSPQRAHTPIIEQDRRGLIKINPLAAWPEKDLTEYWEQNNILTNPLTAEGYSSIGCWPCTERPAENEDLRSGRWTSSNKTECGIHL